MLRCEDCEYFRRDAAGRAVLTCDPFASIKEPECLQKWQVLRLGDLARSYEAMLDMYRHLAPLQERMFKHMERELDDAEEAESWKLGYEEDDETDDGSGASKR